MGGYTMFLCVKPMDSVLAVGQCVSPGLFGDEHEELEEESRILGVRINTNKDTKIKNIYKNMQIYTTWQN